MTRIASKREAAAAILGAINAMSSRFEVADHAEWHEVETACENLIAVLEAMGFEMDVDFIERRDGQLVLAR